jgi:hypothetical protein
MLIICCYLFCDSVRTLVCYNTEAMPCTKCSVAKFCCYLFCSFGFHPKKFRLLLILALYHCWFTMAAVGSSRDQCELLTYKFKAAVVHLKILRKLYVFSTEKCVKFSHSSTSSLKPHIWLVISAHLVPPCLIVQAHWCLSCKNLYIWASTPSQTAENY